MAHHMGSHTVRSVDRDEDPEKFSFVIEDLFGFGAEMKSYICQTTIDCTFAEESWSQKVNEVAPMVEALIEEYE